MRALSLILLAVVLGAVSAAFAGSLTPPGAPASTMKTLQEVYDKADEAEARTPISSIPYTISASGSYYLTQDLGPAAQDTPGITITADNVTLDLNGFALIGAGKAVGSSGSGITLSEAHYNIAVRNGTVRDWREDGVSASAATNSQFEGLRCHNNGQWGLIAGSGATARGNSCRSNGDHGLRVSSLSVITGNTCTYNGGSGIYSSNGSCTITGNTCAGNTVDGIYGHDGSTVSGNTCYNNDGDGIRVQRGCTIIGNSLRYNDGDCIEVMYKCRVVNNTCDGNSGSDAGIHVHDSGKYNSIEHNVVASCAKGILCNPATDNYIASNCAGNNTINYDIVTGNTEGTGDLANISL